MNPKLKILIAILVLAILCGLYFFRDFMFVNTNGQIKYLGDIQNNEWADLIPNYTHSKIVNFYKGWSIQEISSFKWMLTFYFTLGFLLVTWGGLRLAGHKKISNLSIAFYGGVFILSFAISMFAIPVATELMHLLHSPVPYLVLLATIRLKSFLDTNDETE